MTVSWTSNLCQRWNAIKLLWKSTPQSMKIISMSLKWLWTIDNRMRVMKRMPVSSPKYCFCGWIRCYPSDISVPSILMIYLNSRMNGLWIWDIVPVIVLTIFIRQYHSIGMHRKMHRLFLLLHFMNSPSLVKSMIKSFWFPFVMAACLKLIHDICQFVKPFMLPTIIHFSEDTDAPRVLLWITNEF